LVRLGRTRRSLSQAIGRPTGRRKASSVPSCWLQPFALRTAHELLRARHLALNATQQITPLFDTQFPVLLTDIAVLNTFALATLPGYLRARWLLPAPYADRSAFDTWRSLLHADCSALFTLRPAMNPFHSLLTPVASLRTQISPRSPLSSLCQPRTARVQHFSGLRRPRIATRPTLCARPERELLRVRCLTSVRFTDRSALRTSIPASNSVVPRPSSCVPCQAQIAPLSILSAGC